MSTGVNSKSKGVLLGTVDKRRPQWKEALSCHAPGNSLPKWEAQCGHILGMINDVKFAANSNTSHLVWGAADLVGFYTCLEHLP